MFNPLAPETIGYINGEKVFVKSSVDGDQLTIDFTEGRLVVPFSVFSGQLGALSREVHKKQTEDAQKSQLEQQQRQKEIIENQKAMQSQAGNLA